MIKHTFALAAMLTALTQSPALAGALPQEPDNFTLEVALNTAARHNPSIQAAEAKLEQAKLDKEQADLWWAQAINANANYVAGQQGYGSSVTATGTVLPTAAIGIGMNLGNLLNGPKQSARATQNIVIAEAELRKTTLQTASAVTAAYAEYQAAKQVASMSPEMVQAAETDMRVAERSFERGLSQANSLVGARLAVHHTRIDSVTLGGNVMKSWSNLLNVMGDDRWVDNSGAASADRR
jgi:outer membrane protein TolC